MSSVVNRSADAETPISIGQLLARSARFKDLFTQGMALVDESAAYLDGRGRTDAKLLPLRFSAAYSAESMRLTTRLMQIASWLLIRRAVLDGEMSPADADRQRASVRISAQNIVSTPAVFAQLPEQLRDLTERSLRLQQRILHLDSMVNGSDTEDRSALAPRGLDLQLARLRSAFGTGG